ARSSHDYHAGRQRQRKSAISWVRERPEHLGAVEESDSYAPGGAGTPPDWLKRSQSQRAAVAPANAVARVRTSAAAVGHGPGTIGSNAGVRPITRPMKPSRLTPYARVAGISRRRGASAIRMSTGANARMRGGGPPAGAPGAVPFFRAISKPTATGEVGSLAISSSMTETGCMISKPTRAIVAPIKPSTITMASTATGAHRRPVRHAAVTRAKGRRRAPRIENV